MIKIQIMIKGINILEDNQILKPNIGEVGLALWQLEKAKQELLNIDFEADWED